jgi:hypothetical protein
LPFGTGAVGRISQFIETFRQCSGVTRQVTGLLRLPRAFQVPRLAPPDNGGAFSFRDRLPARLGDLHPSGRITVDGVSVSDRATDLDKFYGKHQVLKDSTIRLTTNASPRPSGRDQYRRSTTSAWL